MEFSNTTTEDGAIQEIDRIAGSTNATYSLKAKTARVNQVLGDWDGFVVMFDKSWSYDDANLYDHDTSAFPSESGLVARGLPIAVARLREGHQDTPLPPDLLVLKAVYVKDKQGKFHTVKEETDTENSTILEAPIDANGDVILSEVQRGTPTKFRVIGSSILWDNVPDYDSEKGVKFLYTRRSSRFTDEDTTKQIGIPVIFHPWLCMKAALPHMRRNSLPDTALIQNEVNKYENPLYPGSIPSYLSNRNRTRKPRLATTGEDNR